MSSGDNSDEEEVTIERDRVYEDEPKTDVESNEVYEDEPKTDTEDSEQTASLLEQIEDDEIRQLKDKIDGAAEAEKISEAAFNLGFLFFEGSLGIVTLIIVAISLTIQPNLYPLAGVLMIYITIFELIRRMIKYLNLYMAE